MNGINMPTTKRGQKTYDSLVMSAIGLFHTKGYHQTTIAEIAEDAGVSVGTFYIYFTDKYSLYRGLLNRFDQSIRKTMAGAVKGAINREQAERSGIKAFIKYVRDHPYVYTIIWQSLQVDKSLFIDYYTNFAARYVDQLQKSAQVGELVKVDLQTLAYALMGISNFVGLQINILEPNLKDDHTIDHLIDNLFDALRDGLFGKKS